MDYKALRVLLYPLQSPENFINIDSEARKSF